MPSCELCGREELMPFRCPYCGRSFCVDHRLPEGHECPDLWMARSPAERPPPPKTSRSLFRRIHPRDYGGRGVEARGVAWFGAKEPLHLGLGATLVLLVGLSLVRWSRPPWYLLSFAGIIAIAFMAHELAHKYVAQRNGLKAEFRVNMYGVILTLISIVSPLKIIAPGAVMIAGYANIPLMGLIAAAGPLTNIVMASILFPLAFTASLAVAQLLILGSFINLLIAVFNLIPFGIFDGYKVFAWSKKTWGLLFALSLAFFIYVWLLIQPF